MPITTPIALRAISPEEFARLDYQIMRLAFESQNEMGRLCDEVIYQNDLAARITAAGLGPVRVESPILVTHREFSKTYSTDLIVADAAIYELKTVAALTKEHEAQSLHYLFLHDGQHGKLINFRPGQVETRFVNNVLTRAARYGFQPDTSRWLETDEATRRLRMLTLELLKDWGAFLEVSLYTEALTFLLGGETNVIRMIPLKRNGVLLGNQRLHLLTPEMAFRVTALADGGEPYGPHLRSLLRHSPLRAIQWINMSRTQIQFATLTR
jgi:GxxExxY protein